MRKDRKHNGKRTARLLWLPKELYTITREMLVEEGTNFHQWVIRKMREKVYGRKA